MKNKLFILIISLLFLFDLSNAQKYIDRIITKTNDTIYCLISLADNELIYYKYLENDSVKFSKIRVSDISYKVLVEENFLYKKTKSDDYNKQEYSLLLDGKYPSIRIKTELVSFIGLNPNIYIENRFNKLNSISVGYLAHFNGIIWTAPYLLEESSLQEWWALKGYGFDIAYKRFTNPRSFYLIKAKTSFLKYKGSIWYSERPYDIEDLDIKRNNIHLQVLFGKENLATASSFNEFYYGIGCIILYKNYSYGSVNGMWEPMTYNNGEKVYGAVTFHIGYNIGVRAENNKNYSDLNDY